MFRKKRYVQPRIDTNKKSWSLAFYLSIPCTFFLTLSIALSLKKRLDLSSLSTDSWITFAYSAAGSAALLMVFKVPTLKTFMHELKHAVVVVLTGNKLNEFKVYRDIGHVSYSMFHNKRQFAPFILLAPYFFPLLSLPALIAVICLEGYVGTHILSPILGACLAADLVSAWEELHPHQSDLKRIFGGRLFVLVFLLGANLLWISLCLIWPAGGRELYVASGYELLEFSREALKYAAAELNLF